MTDPSGFNRKGVPKKKLLSFVHAQPEVVWPTKVCAWKDPEDITVAQLKKALTGNHGYFPQGSENSVASVSPDSPYQFYD